MKHLLCSSLAVMLLAGCGTHPQAARTSEPELPIASGTYRFQHRFAEQPELTSIDVIVKVRGHRIRVINETESSVFPRGVLSEGQLMWHASTNEWFIGESAEDRDAVDVGGCSDGPEVVDLVKRIYWTC